MAEAREHPGHKEYPEVPESAVIGGVPSHHVQETQHEEGNDVLQVILVHPTTKQGTNTECKPLILQTSALDGLEILANE